MTDPTTRKQSWLDIGGKVGAVITPLGVLVLLLLQSQFESRKDYIDDSAKLNGRVESIEKILVQMAEASKINDRQESELADHENRLRSLEHLKIQP